MKKCNDKMHFLLTDKQKDYVRKQAKKLDISMSDYLRTIIKIEHKKLHLNNLLGKENRIITELNILTNKVGISNEFK